MSTNGGTGGVTKGSWRVVEHSWSDTSVVGPDGTICTISIYAEATEENQQALEKRSSERANLIASAPDLLEALKGLVNANPNKPDWKARWDKCRSAIARADGEG